MKFTYLITFISIFSHVFEKQVQNALQVLNEHRGVVDKIKNSSNANNKEALSIVFPEMIRWNEIQDFVETSTNELIYVNRGSISTDFSIGYFQIKPSFVENLENYIKTHDTFVYLNYVVISGKDEKKCRKERIERLKQLDWQIRYAHIYWLIASDMFKNRTFKNAKDRIRFFATAYNYGFQKPEKEIELWQSRKAFPYGTKYKGEQLSFGDFSVEFYEKYSKQFD